MSDLHDRHMHAHARTGPAAGIMKNYSYLIKQCSLLIVKRVIWDVRVKGYSIGVTLGVISNNALSGLYNALFGLKVISIIRGAESYMDRHQTKCMRAAHTYQGLFETLGLKVIA